MEALNRKDLRCWINRRRRFKILFICVKFFFLKVKKSKCEKKVKSEFDGRPIQIFDIKIYIYFFLIFLLTSLLLSYFTLICLTLADSFFKSNINQFLDLFVANKIAYKFWFQKMIFTHQLWIYIYCPF
jgi:hypothetical protein